MWCLCVWPLCSKRQSFFFYHHLKVMYNMSLRFTECFYGCSHQNRNIFWFCRPFVRRRQWRRWPQRLRKVLLSGRARMCVFCFLSLTAMKFCHRTRGLSKRHTQWREIWKLFEFFCYNICTQKIVNHHFLHIHDAQASLHILAAWRGRRCCRSTRAASAPNINITHGVRTNGGWVGVTHTRIRKYCRWVA